MSDFPSQIARLREPRPFFAPDRPLFLSRRELLGMSLAGAGISLVGETQAEPFHADRPPHDVPRTLIGYNEYRTDLPGGMLPYMSSHRACVVRANGSGRRHVGEELAREPHSWVQFAGWTPDGQTAILVRGWESPENAAWEEAHQGFRFSEGWLLDTGLYELKTGKFSNLTAVERVSTYNTGFSFFKNDPNRLGFSAIVEGQMQPFVMDRDGHNKKRLTQNVKGWIYSLTVSPDGKRGAYHEDYQLYLCDADGSNAQHVQTGQPFNFIPQWSPDGEWVLFQSGEHYKMDVYLVRRDGTDLHKIADRQGYSGVVETLEKPAFHSARSDVSVWSPDGRWIYYTAQFGSSTEIMRVSLEGHSERLTHSQPGVLNYQPTPSPDSGWLVIGSNRTGRRQLYVLRGDGRDCYPLTDVGPGWGAMLPYWQPTAMHSRIGRTHPLSVR